MTDQSRLFKTSQLEAADAEPRERQQMRAADTAQARDGDALAAQRLLLGRRDPSQVARKRRVVVEGSRHR